MNLATATPSSLALLAGNASAQPFAAPAAVASGAASAAGGLGQVTLALGLVLLAIFAFAWLARRLRSVGSRPGGSIEVLGEVALGPKERAVLLEVAGVRLLVGVSPGGVNTLHVLGADPAPGATGGTESATAASPVAVPPVRAAFRDLLARSFGR